MKQKHILIIFLTLLVIYIAFELLETSEKNYELDFQPFDPAGVDKFVIIDGAGNKDEFIFTKENDKWSLYSGGRKYQTEDEFVNHIILKFSKLKSIRIDSRQESQWGKYHVTDSLGTKVQIFALGEKVFDIVVGKFSPVTNNNSLGSMQGIRGISMVRVAGKNNVYATEGFFSLSLGRGLKDFRNQVLLKINNQDVNRIIFKNNSSTFTLSKNDSSWQKNNQNISLKLVGDYIDGVKRVHSSDFEDEFAPKENEADYWVEFVSSGDKKISIIAFEIEGDSSLIIKSSVNEAYFKINKDSWQQIFKDEDFFVSHSK